MRNRSVLAAALAAASILVSVHPASAACTRLAFSVNDYGKEGPTRDAKNLLDKYIAKWTADRGIKNYKTGPKTVTCELFLNLIVFDEHTCKAEASVCWSGDAPKAARGASASPSAKSQKAAAKPKAAPAKAAQTPRNKATTSPIATGSVKPKAPAAAKAPVAAPPKPAP